MTSPAPRAGRPGASRREWCAHAGECLLVAFRSRWEALDCGGCEVEQDDGQRQALRELARARPEPVIETTETHGETAGSAPRVPRAKEEEVAKTTTRYDALPEAAAALLAEAIAAKEFPSAALVYKRLVEAGVPRGTLGTTACLRQHIKRRRADRRPPAQVVAKLAAGRAKRKANGSSKAPPPLPFSVTCRRAASDDEPPVRDATVSVYTPAIEVLPDGSLRTSDPELAVRLSKMLAR